jgi:predicted nucleic acid-binding protein
MILLDTDVILDVALDRSPHVGASAALLDLAERRAPAAFVAWHTLSNLYYLLRPTRSGNDVKDLLVALTEFARVAPVDTDAFRLAVALPMADLEDAMQVAAAQACGAMYIATRSVRDFERSPVPARKPEQLLEIWR